MRARAREFIEGLIRGAPREANRPPPRLAGTNTRRRPALAALGGAWASLISLLVVLGAASDISAFATAINRALGGGRRRRASGAVRAPQMPSSGCTKSSSEGSKPRPCCRRQTPPLCCSARCSHPVRSTCARLMAGRRSLKTSSVSQSTLPHETIASCYRRSRHRIPTAFRTAPRVVPQLYLRHTCKRITRCRAFLCRLERAHDAGSVAVTQTDSG